MSCPVCNMSPCICGDSYYKLTDEGFLAHLSVIKRIAKDRGLDARIHIGDIDIDDYISNVNVVVDTSVSLTSMITNFMTVPDYYMKKLNEYKGKSVISFFDEVKNDFDFIGYPLLVAILKVLPNKENIIQLRSKLILNFYINIEDIDYELTPPMVPSKIDDFFNSKRDANAFDKLVYTQRAAYVRLQNEAKDNVKFSEVLSKYSSGMKCISAILTDSANTITSAVEFLCTSVQNGNDLLAKFKSMGKFNNQMRDELQNANYAFCKEFENVVAGDLKV